MTEMSQLVCGVLIVEQVCVIYIVISNLILNVNNLFCLCLRKMLRF